MANIKSFPNNQSTYIGAEEVMHWMWGRTSGVFAAANNAAVTAVEGEMAVTISDGLGWLSDSNKNGICWWNDYEKLNNTKLQLSVDMADGTLNRIDRVVVEWNMPNYVDLPEIKIVKGSLASEAVPPALTNNNTIRQISLARILVNAGTTSLNSMLIVDERLDASVCGLVTDGIQIDTTTMQAGFSSFLAAIEAELNDLNAGTAFEFKRLQFTNVVVNPSAFVSDATYEDFPYRGAIALSGVLPTMTPEVVLGVADAMSGSFAPIAEAYAGGVYIWASDVPEANVTIPTIILWKAV